MTDKLEKSLLEELQCPVCAHYMYPPICQCQNGHSICQECFSKVKSCPKCRGPKSQTARSYALEAIHAKLRVPCKYALSGCKFISLGHDTLKHQIYCKHAPKYCPFRHYDNCQWKEVVAKLKAHLTKKHASNFYVKEKQRFLSQNFRGIKSYHYIYAVIFAFNEFFRVTWDLTVLTGMTRWAVYYMGTPDDAKKFSYKIEFPRNDHVYYNSTHSIVWKSPCEAAPEKDNVKFVDHNCFYVHKSLLDSYCEEGGHLNYRVTLYALEVKDDYSTEVSSLFKEMATNDL